MKTVLENEEDLLSQDFREKVIKEIKGGENLTRKQNEFRKYEISRGKNKKYVVEALSKEFTPATVMQIQNRASDISILKKIVSKLGQTYVAGVERKATQGQEAIDGITKAIDFNGHQEKVDKAYETHGNVLSWYVPTKNYRESVDKPRYDLSARVFSPHMYDVIPDKDNPTVARCVILTDFVERDRNIPLVGAINDDGRPLGGGNLEKEGDGVEQIIANSPADQGREEQRFIWWSDNYHFTTNEKGEYVDLDKAEPDLSNPIGMIPGHFYNNDQDGSFWADAHDDRCNGAININVAITDRSAIANAQGWGQPVLICEDLPERVEGGPHNAIKLKIKSEGAQPSFSYASSNPPLDQWMHMIEQDVALYLSTNNLSVTTVATKLDIQTFPSGVAMLIEKAEVTLDFKHKQTMFRNGEPCQWKIISAWQNVLSQKDSLTEKFAEIPLLPEDPEIELKFMDQKPVVSELDQLNADKLRMDLGIVTLKDLVKKDNPDLSDEQVQEKLMELKQEKADRMQAMADAMGGNQPGNPNPAPGDQGNPPPPDKNNPPPPPFDKGAKAA